MYTSKELTGRFNYDPLKDFREVEAMGDSSRVRGGCTGRELMRMRKLSARKIVLPVSRCLLPKDMIQQWEKHYGRSDFFVIVPAELEGRLGRPHEVIIYAEGSTGYRKFVGRKLPDPH